MRNILVHEYFGVDLEFVEAVRKNVSIDWTIKESARAKLRVIVRRLLRASTALHRINKRRQRRQFWNRPS
jgi:uncharacterized protein with HEPN domain